MTASAQRPIAVVAALPVELAAAASSLRMRRTLPAGGLQGYVGEVAAVGAAPGSGPRPAVAAVLGMGQRAVEDALGRLLAAHDPAAVVLVGLAGGCLPEARPGDLYVPSPMRVEPELGPDGMTLEGRAPLEPVRPVLEAILRAAATAGRPVKVAAGTTVNVIATARAKDSLGRNRGVALCDMETFWAARFCAARGVPFAALRAIFDGVGDALPDVPGLGKDPLWQVLTRRPRAALTLPALGLRMWKVKRAMDPVARGVLGELAAL